MQNTTITCTYTDCESDHDNDVMISRISTQPFFHSETSLAHMHDETKDKPLPCGHLGMQSPTLCRELDSPRQQSSSANIYLDELAE